jgi:hypothetical protein
MPDKFCSCKSYCATYNHETGTYSRGQFVSRTTAFRHRLDDNRSATLDNFTRHVASSMLSEAPGLGPINPNSDVPFHSSFHIAALPAQVTTLEGEIRDRVPWTTTARPLVFAIDPVPDLEFNNPLASSYYIPNDGLHALNPSHHNNLAFIENESRLYEIFGLLRTNIIAVDQEVLDDLVEKVSAGLDRMMEHKRCEWERQRTKLRVIAKGYTVVNTGEICE